MNRYFVAGIFLLIGHLTGAAGQDGLKQYNLLTFRQIEAESPWLQTNNAAGLSQMPELFPAQFGVGTDLTGGNFHSVFEGQSRRTYQFSTQSFRKINQLYLYGSFRYDKSTENEVNFANTNDPVFNNPYLLTDTLGNDTYNREFFNLQGSLSSPVNTRLDWGIGFGYRVGVASQNRDPRALNKVSNLDFAPGLVYKGDCFKLGASLRYGYYNEDIDLLVVNENRLVTSFQLLGLGHSEYHVSSSFFRLYQQQQVGGSMQVEWRSGNVSNLLHSAYNYSVQTIDDGRKGSVATWAVTKNDSRLDGRELILNDVISIHKKATIHQIKLMFRMDNKLGTEFIQRLEKVNEADLEQWVTYGKVQKYYSLRTEAGLNYQLISNDERSLMKSLFNASANYEAFSENYYLPDHDQFFSNLTVAGSWLKLYVLKRSSLSAEVNLTYRFNLRFRQNLEEDNVIVQKIIKPEFNYQTKSYLAPAFSLGYQVPLKKAFYKYFLKANFEWRRSVDQTERTMAGLSTGLIF